MNAELKDYIMKCRICRNHESAQAKEPLISHEVPNRPWAKVGTDLFTLHNKNYLIVVDYTSNFWEIDYLPETDSQTVIRKLKMHFARYGIPDQVMSDNGPQFSSNIFKKFSEMWDFEHITSSPGHSRSNGKAESAVKTAKKLMMKAKEDGKDSYLALLDYRNTPAQATHLSPAQVLMSRRTKTLMPTTANLLKPKVTYEPRATQLNQARQAKYYNRNAKELEPLNEGDIVRMQPFHPKEPWKKAVVTKRLDERSYEVETNDRSYRRNRVHLKASKEKQDMNPSKTQPVPETIMNDAHEPRLDETPEPKVNATPETSRNLSPPTFPTTTEPVAAEVRLDDPIQEKLPSQKTSTTAKAATPVKAPIRTRYGRVIKAPVRYEA
jgi:transposase InsO family protein